MSNAVLIDNGQVGGNSLGVMQLTTHSKGSERLLPPTFIDCFINISTQGTNSSSVIHHEVLCQLSQGKAADMTEWSAVAQVA